MVYGSRQSSRQSMTELYAEERGMEECSLLSWSGSGIGMESGRILAIHDLYGGARAMVIRTVTLHYIVLVTAVPEQETAPRGKCDSGRAGQRRIRDLWF